MRVYACIVLSALLYICLSLVPPAYADDAASPPAFEADLACIDLSDPAYARAIETGERDRALQLLVEHFALRPRLQFDVHLFTEKVYASGTKLPYMVDTPDEVLNNRFAFMGERLALEPAFDWNGQLGSGDREATWWINRFFFLHCLSEATEQTGERRYARHGVGLILDWIHKNPVDRADKLWAAWRPLEIGLRLVRWSAFVDHLVTVRLIEPEELATILTSIHQQANYLVAHSGPRRGNQGFMQQAGIGIAALTFPELSDADRLLAGALGVFTQDVAGQIYPDGAQEELSAHYEITVIHSLGRVLDLARQRRKQVPPELTDTLRRMVRYVTFVSKPDGTLPMLNDGDHVDCTPLLSYLAKTFKVDEVTSYLQGKEPEPAVPLCHIFPYSGVAIFRDRWTPDARYLLFEAGPFGTGHQHEDALQFDVAAFGRDFIVDPGRYSYVDSPFRHYFVSSRSHATVSVDGGGQVRRLHRETWRPAKAIDEHFVSGHGLALAVGEYTSGYSTPQAEGVTHRREVLFVSNEYWVISDVIQGTGRHRIEQHFQYAPGELKLSEQSAVTQNSDANLLLLWAWPTPPRAEVKVGQQEPVLGWYSPSYAVAEPAPYLTLAEELDLPARLTLVLYPFKGPQPAARLEGLPVEGPGPADSGAVRLQMGDRVDAILLSDPRQPPRPRSLGNYRTTAPAAVVTGAGLIELVRSP